MQDSVKVSEHVSRWWDVMTPHHHHTQQLVGRCLAPAEGWRQRQGLEKGGRSMLVCQGIAGDIKNVLCKVRGNVESDEARY